MIELYRNNQALENGEKPMNVLENDARLEKEKAEAEEKRRQLQEQNKAMQEAKAQQLGNEVENIRKQAQEDKALLQKEIE